jgi:hypothetical protein
VRIAINHCGAGKNRAAETMRCFCMWQLCTSGSITDTPFCLPWRCQSPQRLRRQRIPDGLTRGPPSSSRLGIKFAQRW